MTLVVDIVTAPLELIWHTLTAWWFWALAVPACVIVLAVLYRHQLTMTARDLLVTAGDLMLVVLPVIGSFWTAGSNARGRLRRKGRS